jgi:hypothetical protein
MGTTKRAPQDDVDDVARCLQVADDQVGDAAE